MSATMRTETIQWGVLGCARVAEKVVIPGIQRSENGTVRGVASRDPRRARAFADRLDIERSYPDYDALLNDPDIQAVYIPLPNGLHREWTIKAADRGKHVLCEKTLACDAREAEDMIVRCRQNRVLLMEAFAHRFHPQNLLVKQFVAEGRIGRILAMVSVHASGRPPSDDIKMSKALGGGVLMDKGCYCVNTARFLFEAEPLSVYARVEMGAKSGVDERVTAMLTFPGDVAVWFDSHYHLAPDTYQQGYQIIGERGRICVPSGFVQLRTYRQAEIVDTTVSITNADGETENLHVGGVHQWQLEAAYFADCVLRGDPIRFPSENGLANTKVVEAIFHSGTDGRPQQIDTE